MIALAIDYFDVISRFFMALSDRLIGVISRFPDPPFCTFWNPKIDHVWPSQIECLTLELDRLSSVGPRLGIDSTRLGPRLGSVVGVGEGRGPREVGCLNPEEKNYASLLFT